MKAVYLGRGHSQVVFENGSVLKTAPRIEPIFMSRFPEVFVPIEELPNGDPVQFKMPCYEVDITIGYELAFRDGLKKLQILWERSAPRKAEWRLLLHTHLLHYVHVFSLNVNLRLIDRLISSLPDVAHHNIIHGDPTYANIVLGPTGWCWIDPLDRAYIPGDPHVDLGKMFQSCWGYEKVLCGEDNPTFDESFAEELADQAGLDFEIAFQWCMIHLIRLLPYQDRRVKSIYEQIIASI